MTTIQLRDDLTTDDADLDQSAPESDDDDSAVTTTDPPEAAAAPADKPKRARRARKVAAAEAVVRGHANGHTNGSAAFAVSAPDVDSIESRVDALVGEIRAGIASCDKREAEESARHEGVMSEISQERIRYQAQLSKLGVSAEVPAARKVAKPARTAASKPSSARMPRRSAEDIDAGVQRVVDHLKKHADGLRAEQIKADLGIDRKELPKLLKTAIAEKLIRSRGAKRSTTYTAR